MKDGFIYMFYNACSLAMMWYTIDHCLDRRKGPQGIFLTEAGCVIGSLLVGYFAASLDVMRPIIMLTFFIVPTLFLYRNKTFRKLLVVICVFFTAVLADTLMFLLAPMQTLDIHDRRFYLLTHWWYIRCLFLQAIALFLVFILLPKRAADSVDRLPARQYWFFLFFPISQLALFAPVYFSLGKQPSAQSILLVIVLSLVCLTADIVWFREIRRISDNARLKAENDLLGKQIDAQREYYKLLTANYADLSMMRHDIANHIYTIRALLQDGKSDEAMQYAAKLEQARTARSVLSACKNSIVHSFLQHRLEELTAQAISTAFEVSLAPQVGVSDTDLIIALGNLLDNAAEACASASEKRVWLTVTQVDGFVHMETKNTCAASPQPKKRRVAYLERGVGTSILQALAEQYHGSYISSPDDGVNHAVLVLREN